ncbi:hypothetical protein PR048_004386 [Dryococelus australis]|uniref:Heme oxygenase n=1 Tax=Dryococelus australis TaxID=614101 RepID=A0ABQ9I5S7_9NEOP|nr:hypothetical protein PR048_004386 [Dryococelus australis]
MERHKNTHIFRLDIEGLRRTEAFEKDLIFYLGKDWKNNYVVRESVAAYLLHLRKIESSNPNLLLAYIYHLYMGLLSGGQLLMHKRKVLGKFPFTGATREGGTAVTNFGDITISKLKRDVKAAMNSVAEDLDETTKQMLIEESKTVFVKNNEIIRTVKGGTEVVVMKLLILLIPLSVALMLLALILFYNK